MEFLVHSEFAALPGDGRGSGCAGGIYCPPLYCPNLTCGCRVVENNMCNRNRLFPFGRSAIDSGQSRVNSIHIEEITEY